MDALGLEARCRIGNITSVAECVKIGAVRLQIVDDCGVIAARLGLHGHSRTARFANLQGDFTLVRCPKNELPLPSRKPARTLNFTRDWHFDLPAER